MGDIQHGSSTNGNAPGNVGQSLILMLYEQSLWTKRLFKMAPIQYEYFVNILVQGGTGGSRIFQRGRQAQRGGPAYYLTVSFLKTAWKLI